MQNWQLNASLNAQEGKLEISAVAGVEVAQFKLLVQSIGKSLIASPDPHCVNLGIKVLKELDQ